MALTTAGTAGTMRRGLLDDLRFGAALEFQFVYSKVSLSLQVLRSSCAFALALYPAFLAYDWLTDRAYVLQWAVLLSFFLSTVTSVVILVATYRPELYRYLPQLVPASLGLNSLALICCVVNLQRNGTYFPYEILVLNQLYSYFLCGLIFRIAVPLAMFSCMAWWAAGWWLTDLTGFVTHGLVLLTITVLGAVTCYYNERIERRAWVQGRELARISIRDEATGLYNERYLRDQGARLLAQARLAGVTLSAMTMEVRGVDLRRHLLGDADADGLLARIASAAEKAAPGPLDIVARTGERQFAWLLYDCAGLSTHAQALCLAGEIEALSQDGSGPPLKIAIGVAYANPGRSATLEELLDHAARARLRAETEDNSPTAVILD